MSTAEQHYQILHTQLATTHGIVSGQMFGKACLKVNGKAFIALHQENVIFKLTGQAHAQALSLTGAKFWDPSGKGRPMREWVSLAASHSAYFTTLADAALTYAQSSH